MFNDESIYLDWAATAFHTPGHAFDSLLDAKQPLLIWIFGIVLSFFENPLFAGRVVSVCFGAFTLTGLYFLVKRLFDKKTAVLAIMLYSCVPLIVFYNRQALMESAISSVGVWSLNLLLRFIDQPSKKRIALLGGILGFGFLIKSSVFLFLLPVLGILMSLFLKKPTKEGGKQLLVFCLVFFSFAYFVLIQPTFWETFYMNHRYTFSIQELLRFPIRTWISHVLGFFEMGFMFITPGVFVASLWGMYQLFQKKTYIYQVLCFFMLSAICLEIFIGKTQSQRYLLPVVPLLLIPASHVLTGLWKKSVIRKVGVGISMGVAAFSSIALIGDPYLYITQTERVSAYAETAHIHGQTAGYGLNEAMSYIRQQSKEDSAFIFFAMNTGNPESAIDLYTQKSSHLYGLYFDAQMFSGLEEYECASSSHPVFFVSRGVEQAGMEKFLVSEKKFPNPDGKYGVGIYTLRQDCVGKTLNLDEIYEPVMKKMKK